jgi:hypothetical protein
MLLMRGVSANGAAYWLSKVARASAADQSISAIVNVLRINIQLITAIYRLVHVFGLLEVWPQQVSAKMTERRKHIQDGRHGASASKIR